MSAVVVGAALVATGCSPVKLGAAAVVGDQRITVATLNTEVTNLSRYAKLYPGTVQLTPAQQTQETLTWLVRFKINDALARQAGITVSTAQAQQALNEIYNAAKASAQAQGITNVTINLILTANGIPPNLGRSRPVPGHRRPVRAAGQRGQGSRYPGGGNRRHGQAQQGQVRGGQAAEDPGQPAVRAAGLHPVLDRRVRPDGDPVRGPGADGIAVRGGAGLLIVLATSPRVAPGLLSWEAWQALRSAAAVLAAAGDPQLPALDEAGIGYR